MKSIEPFMAMKYIRISLLNVTDNPYKDPQQISALQKKVFFNILSEGILTPSQIFINQL